MSGGLETVWAVGEPCYVEAFGTLYRGAVTKVGRKRITVRYTSGTGTTREKAAGPTQVFRLNEPEVLGIRRFDYRHLDGKMEWCRRRGKHVPREGHACCEEAA